MGDTGLKPATLSSLARRATGPLGNGSEAHQQCEHAAADAEAEDRLERGEDCKNRKHDVGR